MKKKNILNLILTMAISLIFPLTTKAATSVIDLTASSTKVVTGNNVTVYVNVSSSSALGSYEYDISYNTSVLKLVSSSSGLCSSKHCIWNTSGSNSKSVTYTFTFKAIGTGSTSVSVKNTRVIGYNESEFKASVSPVTIKVITQEQLEASYSKDNYLKSLSVSGHKISPAFNKDTLKYTVTLDSTVEKITVNATKNDSRAKLSGTGKVKVSEGDNIIKVVVTAENGSKRTYTIVATVKELNPIKVTVDDKEYTVVKKENLLTSPENFINKTVKIDDTEIPAFYNELNDYTLVGLKNSEGDIELFIYNENDNSYRIYKEYKFDKVTLELLDLDTDIPKGYKETEIDLNDETVKAYTNEDNTEFALIYALNINTGKKGFYKYDTVEQTVQRYEEKDNTEQIDTLKNKYESLLILLGTTLALVLIIVIFSSLFSSSKSKKKKKEKLEKEKQEAIKNVEEEKEKKKKNKRKNKSKKKDEDEF